jgi:hypothetical protein
MARHVSLDQLEAEIRDTRARLAALLARADRDYAFRPILHALQRGAGREIAAPEPQAAPTSEPEHGAHMTRLALPAAVFGFALAFLALHRKHAAPSGGQKDAAEK